MSRIMMIICICLHLAACRVQLRCATRSYVMDVKQSDDSGTKSCRGSLRLAACAGQCFTDDYSVHGEPQGRQLSCFVKSYEKETFQLTDCDEGVTDDLRVITLPVIKSCGCLKCNNTISACDARIIKHSQETKRDGSADDDLSLPF